MNAVERMVEYTSQQPEGLDRGHGRLPLQGWPQAGAIVVSNLQVCSAQPRCRLYIPCLSCPVLCSVAPCPAPLTELAQRL